MAAAYSLNLSINSDTTFKQSFNLTENDGSALDLTNYTYAAQLRKHSSSNTSTSFTVTAPNPTAGEIVISLSPSDTSSLKEGRYVYDIVITNNNDNAKTRVIEGSAILTKTVTR